MRAAGLPEAAIQLVPTTDREAVGLMLKGLDGAIDVIVPRGGKSLVARVQEEARVPVFAHLEGICHTYVDRSADLAMAKAIAVNAKMRRTGVCGATETLLVDAKVPAGHLPALVDALIEAGCEVRGDQATQAADDRVTPASEQDWSTEYLDAIISVKTVDGVDGAIAHIQKYGSQHTDCIVAEDRQRGRALPRPPRQRDRAAQRLDPVRRRRRVRHGRRDRHRHRPPARPRPRRRRAAHHLQVCRARHRPDAADVTGKTEAMSKSAPASSAGAEYTAVIKHDDAWWIGWIEEVPGVNCQERTREKLLESLRLTLHEALQMNRQDARAAAGKDFVEVKIAV